MVFDHSNSGCRCTLRAMSLGERQQQKTLQIIYTVGVPPSPLIK